MKLTELNQRLEAALRDRISRLNPMTRQLLWWIVVLLWAVLLATPAHGQAYEADYSAKKVMIDEQIASLVERSPTFAAAVEELGDRLNVIPARLPGNLLAATPYQPGVNFQIVYVDVEKMEQTGVSDWDALLAHEIYGHALPWVLGQKKCRDPEGHQSFIHSCVGKREAEILIELGRSPRLNYSF